MADALARLRDVLVSISEGAGAVSIAVSGGVDSLTLAAVAHDILPARLHHAVSPAVPEAATRRTRALAADRGWTLDVFDAGEFADPRYRANPANRCFFCKINLYGEIRRRTAAPILSGTNLDDLGEYRPGLDAAREHGVRHPFVEAGIDKAALRRIARDIGLGDIAALPASPCLSSRVETGIAIAAPVLAMIDQAETMLREALAPRTIRCRVRASGLVIELDEATLATLDAASREGLRATLTRLAATAGLVAPVGFAVYRNGSAFLRPAA